MAIWGNRRAMNPAHEGRRKKCEPPLVDVGPIPIYILSSRECFGGSSNGKDAAEKDASTLLNLNNRLLI